MRFVLALVALVAALGMVGLGVAQRTVLKPADHVTLSLHVPDGVRYVVVPGTVLTANAGRQRLQVSGSATAFAAYGRSSDVIAWLAGARYAQVGIGGGGALTATERTAPRLPGIATGGGADPDGSDLWLDQNRASGTMTWPMNVPASVSLLVASDGTSAAPSDLSLNWPVRTGTPWAVPLILIGGTLGVVGLLLYVWALVHVRRRRGPRRRPPAKTPRAPQPRYRQIRTPVSVTTRGRRSVRNRVAVAAGLILALLASGSPALAAPPVSAAGPSATAAVTDEQAARIVQHVADIAAQADATLDAKLLAERFAGPALALRTAAYTLHKKNKKAALPQAIPDAQARIGVTLPQATTSWPRALFAVVADSSDATVPPVALTLVQDAPREPYTVRYETPLEPKVALPTLPSSSVGAPRLSSDSDLLRVRPEDLAADYGLLLRKTDPALGPIFDIGDDPLAAEVGVAAKQKAAKALGSTATMTFDDVATDPADVVAMSTAVQGAIVAVDLEERETVKPKGVGSQVQTSGGVKTLSKVAETSKGIVSVYGYQLLFSVPAVGSNEPVQLLGYAQGLVSAKEL